MSLAEIDFQRDAAGRAIAPDAEIGDEVYLGNNVTIYPGVRLGRGCVVQDNAVLGRLPVSTSTIQLPVQQEYGALEIGAEAVIGTNAVVYTNCHIGPRSMIADGASVREGCVIGEGVVIGRGSMLGQNCHVGDFARLHDLCIIVASTTIEAHVFLGPGVRMANDNDIYLSRFELADLQIKAAVIRKYAVLGSGVSLLPNIEVGTGAMAGTGAVLTRDVEPWTLVAGVPAKKIKDIPAEWRQKVLEKFEGDLS